MPLIEFRKFVVDFESHSERQLLLHIAYKLHFLEERIETLMADTSALTAAVAQLDADVDALIAQGSGNAGDQAVIDAATASVQAVDAKVTAATTPTP